MNSEMNNKELIQGLYQKGVAASDIAAQIGLSRQYVYRCLSGDIESDRTEKPPLNVANYIKVVKRGYDTRQDLARHFRVSRDVISDFEKESGILQLLTKYYYIQGKSLSEIGQRLHIRIGSIEIPPDLPTIDKVRQDLKTMLDVYGEMAKYGDAETVRYNELKRLLYKF
jgi:DNA-directed RNA polymerase specialized sigma subunit